MTRIVRLALTAPGADTVFVAGTFNNWNPAVSEMLKSNSGEWIKDISLEPGDYEYRFVVDGAWIADPGNPVSVTNPFGGHNSLLVVPPIKP